MSELNTADMFVNALLHNAQIDKTQEERNEIGKKLVEWAERQQQMRSEQEKAENTAKIIIDLIKSEPTS
jgi:hypothetical protein